ncbi:acetylhydrolase (plasmid) [Streptomyces sp. NBC_01136]|uniref:alpha/beta hydrolase family protein n=1 Tax=unclassified Streptomyces TaxID=2593676 RepID=UPI002F90A8EB|nr:acetylhydrolase [Streptomyces sp. NBC_01136]
MTITAIGRRRMTRRAVLAAAAAVPIGVASHASAAPATRTPAQLTLPVPTGPYPVGTVALHLVDGSRPDPVAGPGHYREVMASVWYPAREVGRYPRARWMAAAPLRALLTSAGFEPDAVMAPLTVGHEGAPVRRTGGRWPVVVFSHGAHDHRADTTIVVQELASHGYVVVTVDHTYDAFSEFPDGRLTVPSQATWPAIYATDIQFVLDRIEDLDAGRNPDAEHRPLPAGLRGALDLHRIGMFGWSKGGTATTLVMSEDQRVRAGLSLDGPMQPVITTDLDRPFMMMTAEFTRAQEPSVAEFWSHLRGWRLNVQADGAVHRSYGDYQALIPQLAKVVGMSDEELRGWIGTLDPARAVRIQQAYPLAFFDLHLRHLRHRGHLLDGPSAAFPEVKFIP